MGAEINGFQDFIKWCDLYNLIEYSVLPEDPHNTIILLEAKEDKAPFKLVVPNAEANLFFRVWGLIWEARL